MEGEMGEHHESQKVHAESNSARFIRALEANVKTVIKEYSVEGESVIGEIPQGMNVIFAPTHRSDVELQLAAAVIGKKKAVKITGYRQNIPYAVLGVGKDNFIPIDARPIQPIDQKGKAREFVGEFNPNNFITMKEEMEKGFGIVLPAHNPTFDWKLPDRAGMGPAYLAQIAGPETTVVVPIGIDIHSKEPVGRTSKMANPRNIKQTLSGLLNRPNATVRFGKPLHLEQVDTESLVRFQEIMAKDPSQRTHDESSFRRKFMLELERVGRPVVESIAAMDPPEKRGKWQVSEAES